MKQRFIGRKRELEVLNKLYKEDGFSLTILYGRRRIGKSTLLNKFIGSKKCIFYTCSKVGTSRNIELFGQEVINVINPKLANVKFNHLEDLLDFINENVGNNKLVIVIDELPYWAKDDKGMLSILQKYIDNKWIKKNIMLILCGSSLSFMEDEVLSQKSPLYGRRNNQIKLNAFDYLEAGEFVKKYSNEDKAIVYGITGGVPKYLSFFNDEISLDENIKNLYFHSDGFLYDEAKNFLSQEFSDTKLVNNVIEQIANGENSLNDISSKLNEANEKVLYTLNKLISVDVVEKRQCITEEKNKKKTMYCLKDTMFKFWYRYIPKAISSIEVGNGDMYYQRIVKPTIHSYMGPIFENMCQYYVLKNINKNIDMFITESGYWWGNKHTQVNGKITSEATDIDVVGVDPIKKEILIGECKFKNSLIDKDIYESLIKKTDLISKYKVGKYLYFSLIGYSDWVIKNKSDKVLLLKLDDLYK